MKRWTLLLSLVLCGMAAPAEARVMPVTGLTVHYEDCPFYADGGACARPETAEVWVTDDPRRFAVWHEIGHVFDHQALNDEQRAWFADLFGFPAGSAWLGDHEHYARPQRGVPLPGEVFADAFAACWMGLRPEGVSRGRLQVGRWNSAYGYYPSARLHQRVCNAIAVLGLLRSTADARGL